ncbi:hypothetical protein ACFLW6_02380 [Chloroflexota bacterium]
MVVTEQEFKFALSPHPIHSPIYRKDLFKDLKFMLVSGQFEIASVIQLITVPGHTPGTQAVVINTEKGKAIITGLCGIKENFEPPKEVREILPVLAPGVHLNAVDAFDSALRIKDLADILIPIHDSSFIGIESIP